MSPRNLLNLILLVVVAALVLLAVYEPGKEEPQTVELTALNKQAVDSISIVRQQARKVRFEKADEQWTMREPYQLPVNDFKVNELLRLVSAESFAQRDLAKLDKSKFGLDEPLASITFNDSETLHFGTTDPVNNHRYVQYKGTLHVITDTFYYQLGRKAIDFLGNQLLAGDHAITAITLPGLQLQLGDEGWEISPAVDEISQDRINELLDNWQHAQAIDIEPWEAKDGDFDQTIRIERRGQEPVEFALISHKPKFILARPDKHVQYELPEDQYSSLMQLPPAVEAPQDAITDAPPAPTSPGDE